jgi:hypothetical protein
MGKHPYSSYAQRFKDEGEPLMNRLDQLNSSEIKEYEDLDDF